MSLLAMIEASFFAAFALILDLLPSISLGPWLSFSIAMVPIFILAFRWGFKVSFIAGFIWGLLQVAVGDVYFLTPIQFLIEYFIAFAFIGFAGLFYEKIQSHLKYKTSMQLVWAVVAIVVGSAARYFWHFVAGIIFWGDYAPEGMSPAVYSLLINGGSMIGSAILCSIVIVALLATAPRLIQRNGISVKPIEKNAS